MRKWSRFTKIMGKTVRPLSEKKKKRGSEKSFSLGQSNMLPNEWYKCSLRKSM